MSCRPTSTDLELLSPSGRMLEPAPAKAGDEGNQSNTFVDDFDPLSPTLSRREREKRQCLSRKDGNGCGDDWIKHSYIYEIPAVLRDIREALGDRRCEERHLLPHEERFSTSPVSIRSTPSAPRSMPPMATCRYICHRSSTTRHAPVITCLTPWLSSRLVGAYATFCRSLLLEITLKVSDLIRPLVAPAFTVGPLSTQSCWGLDNNVRMAYKWHQEVNLWHLYPAAGAPMDDVPGREEISDTRVK